MMCLRQAVFFTMLVPQPDGAGFAGVFNDQVSADLGEFDAIRIRQGFIQALYPKQSLNLSYFDIRSLTKKNRNCCTFYIFLLFFYESKHSFI